MRKKLFATGVFLLLVFQSCNNNEELSYQDNAQMIKVETSGDAVFAKLAAESQTLQGFVANEIAIAAQIKTLLDNEVNVNYSMIQTGIGNVKTVEELELLYRNANVSHAVELISLYEELSLNTQTFINSNPEFYSLYTEEERTEFINNEIDTQLEYNEASVFAKTNCHANFVKASKRCMKKFAMEVGLAAIGGIFTGGTTAVIGSGVATVNMIMCNADADEDYHDCVHEGGQP